MKYPFPDNSGSYWFKQKLDVCYPKLEGDLQADVAIVGGGITGIVTAYILKQAGYTVAVVEKDSIASGTTGGTTGKVTSQHGLIYADLIKQHGIEKARTYGAIYEESIARIESIIKTEGIECGWTRDDNYVYTTDVKRVPRFKAEVVAATECGLPVTYETTSELPFSIRAAVRFANQAKFDAYKFTTRLAETITDHQNYIFENSKVRKITDGDQCVVETEEGRILSRYVVIATLIPPSPMIARAGYALLEYPETSYIVAATIPSIFKGMYISPDNNNYSLLPFEYQGEKVLLVGGENHIPGTGRAEPRLQKLTEYADEYFDINTIQSKWAAMDYIAYDKLPIAGKVYPWSKNIYTITGLKKWGLSGSMVGALTIRDALQGNQSSIVQLFNPNRRSAVESIPRTILEFFKG